MHDLRLRTSVAALAGLAAIWSCGDDAADRDAALDASDESDSADVELDRADVADDADADIDDDAAEPDASPDAGDTVDASEDVEYTSDATDHGEEDGPADAADGGDACDPDAIGWDALVRMTPGELHAALDAKDFALINVHVPYAGEIPGTDVHISFVDVDGIEEYLGHDLCANVVLYCLTGPMSVSAGNALIARGYRRVRDLLGGMDAWEAAGYPLD